MKMWSGRFRQPLDPHFEEWQRSFPFDQKLLNFELAASSAHAQALRAAGIITPAEFGLIVSALDEIGKTSEQQPGYFNDPEAEDVHHFVEKKLVLLTGEMGKKLHSGRSRNEQIATDLRLFVRESIDHVRSLLSDFLETLLDRADEAQMLSMPAYTHLQRAEPVLTSHWLLAYFEMFWRDGERLLDCRERVNECPLGSGAVTGATLPLDRELVSRALGFTRPTANSMDATSDRDFALEFVGDLTMLGIHLSRWAEEFILFATQEYAFIELPQAYSTGSSAMPQKKNPDLLELVRGKTGRVIGNATALMVTLKGLSLAYNKDLQETQEPLFNATDTVLGLLPLVAGWMAVVEFDEERMNDAAQSGFMNAWAAATYLVKRGVPSRLAHEQIGKAVKLCLEKNCELQNLSLEELRGLNPVFEESFYSCLTLGEVLAIHDVFGGTAPGRVRQAIAAARGKIEKMREEVDLHAHA